MDENVFKKKERRNTMSIYVYSKERGVRKIKAGITFEQYKEKVPTAIRLKGKPPTLKTLESWNSQGFCKTIDGCKVEPDGECSHGFPTWLSIFGCI